MKIGIVLLAASFVVVGLPLATASEDNPDCESNQPWIGYRTTAPVRDTYTAMGAPGGLNPCEGEHWDGQDSTNSANPGCTPSASPDPADAYVIYCLGPDPNAMTGEDPLNPLGVRVSSDGSESYVGANIVLVGRVVVYVGPDAVGVYLRDNTPGNLLATVISAARVTQGYVSENDCDQSLYQQGAMSGTPLCGRDNTAITVEHGLLA